MLEKPKLFDNSKEFWIVIFIFLLLISIRLYSLYINYSKFISKPFYYTKVDVLQQYTKIKKSKRYTIIRVHSSSLDIDFFTKIYYNKNLLGRKIRLKLYPSKKMSFLDYLRVGYINSSLNRVYFRENTFRDTLLDKISKFHQNREIEEFYQAIFLAKPISKELREDISKLGINHLIAISGFHLSILWLVLFYIFKYPYQLIQQRYFPYRYNLIDMGFIILLILGWYIYIVNMPPALIRSYFMLFLGWLFLIMGLEVLSFEFLLFTLLLLIAIFPKLLVSLGFWFSILGVFYIFLVLEYFRVENRFFMTLIISVSIYIFMLPIIHSIFPITTKFQLLSPILSIIFTIFYPLSILLHILGLGYILDKYLLALFNIKMEIIDMTLNIYIVIAYIILSICAVFSKRVFYLIFGFATIFLLYQIGKMF